MWSIFVSQLVKTHLQHRIPQNNKLMLEILEKYHNDGLLHRQTHPTKDLTIWNYSPKVQYERLWDDITLQCRGLVTNSKGDIVARPFKKFFNYEEHKPEEIPNENYVVYEKMDGSLGILFNYEGEWILATRGSFTSPQAIKGKEILDRHDISAWRKDNTYLFEIIYPENRIVVDYKGEEKLVVLGAIHTETGEEIPDSSLFWTQDSGFEVAMTYKTWGEGYDLLKEEIQKDREGYVIKFKNGFRMKIKGEEYKRLHKILTNFSSKDIWELLRDGKPMDEFLDRVPDEFYKWVKQQVSSFEYAKYRIREHCGKIHDYFRYGKYGDVDPEPTKKDFALHLEKCDVETFYRPILFAMWDGKPYEHIIWRIMKPKYEKPFKKDEN
jgi:RNA ligase